MTGETLATRGGTTDEASGSQAGGRSESRDARPVAVELTLGEVAALTGVVAVAATGTWSLALAHLGRHDGLLALVLGLVTTALTAVVVRLVGGRPTIRFDLVELGLIAAVVIAGAVFYLPGFHYTYVDKDPGAYVVHGFAIAREGDVAIDDPVIQRGISPAFDSAGRFPGLWPVPDNPGKTVSQFFHFYPALLATAHDLGGSRALFNLNPVLAIGSVVALVVATRRAAGTAPAAVAGALFVTSMIQVWQARYPSSEISAQLLLSGALLAAVLAIGRRWTGAAFVGGLLLGVGFLARPDGFLYIALAAGLVAVATALGRVDRRALALAAGVAIPLPYALWNAYVARADYSRGTNVPRMPILLGAVAVILLGGYVALRVRRAIAARRPGSIFADPTNIPTRWRVGIGAVASGLIAVALVVLYFREDLLGQHYAWSVFTQDVTRSFHERSLPWLSWFITKGGFFIMWVGVCLVLVRRWQATILALVGPGTLLLFLYVWNPRVSTRLMWFVRRFVPSVLPAVIILIAIAIGWVITRRPVLAKIAGVVAAVSLIVDWTAMTWPLRSHDEMGGTWDLTAAIAAQAGDEQGVFLFPPGRDIYDVMRNAPGAVWFVFDQVAARVPDDYDMATITEYEEAFPDKPIFLVERGEELPEDLPPERFTKAGTVTGEVVIWAESRDTRPDHDVVLPVGVTVWQLEPAS